MSFPVIKKAAYVLVNTPDMIIHNGTTQTLEKDINSIVKSPVGQNSTGGFPRKWRS